MEGWIKLHRKTLTWEWFRDSQTVHLFIYLLLSANHEDRKWKGITVKRGQLITGRNALSEATGISVRSIRTCLNKLKSTNELTIKTTNKFSIITICNYEEYQKEKTGNDQQNDQLTDQQLTSNRPASDHKQELKKVKNIVLHDTNIIPPPVDLLKSYCIERKNNVDPQKFLDYYQARGWIMNGGKKMKDWQAAVRTWEKNERINNNQPAKVIPVFHPGPGR